MVDFPPQANQFPVHEFCAQRLRTVADFVTNLSSLR